MPRPVKAISDLKEGTIIRPKGGGWSYVVTANYGTRATAVRTVDVTNPREWEIIPRPQGG